MITSGTLHWLVSQSFFLTIVEACGNIGKPDPSSTNNLSTCGHAPVVILSTLIVGSLALGLGIALDCRKYKPGIPLAGSCSAAISAACHPPLGDDRASEKAIVLGSCGNTDGTWSEEVI